MKKTLIITVALVGILGVSGSVVDAKGNSSRQSRRTSTSQIGQTRTQKQERKQLRKQLRKQDQTSTDTAAEKQQKREQKREQKRDKTGATQE